MAETDDDASPPASEVKEEAAPTSPETKVDPDADDEAPQAQAQAQAPTQQGKEVVAPAALAAPGHDGDMMSVQSVASRSVARMPRRTTVTAASAPFDRSFHQSRFKFYCPPRQRQKWEDFQILPRTNW